MGEGARFVVTNDCCLIIKINIKLEKVFEKHYDPVFPPTNHMPDTKRKRSVQTYIDEKHENVIHSTDFIS